ncbi:MAG: hypothetical protein AAF639_28135 [Chloroflexota bacterium]
MQASPMQTVPGETVFYNISGRNNSRDVIENAMLSATLPANTTFDAASSTEGWMLSGSRAANQDVYVINIGNVPPGGLMQAVFAVVVSEEATESIAAPTVSLNADDGVTTQVPAAVGNNVTILTPTGLDVIDEPGQASQQYFLPFVVR